MIDPFTMGILMVMGVIGIAVFFLYSSASGPTTLLKGLGVASAGGIVGSVIAVFTDAYKFVIACAYGHLGWYGYLLIIGIGACLIIWAYNGWKDLKANRPLSFVE